VNDDAVRAEGLRKRYGDKNALDGFDLTVRRGTVHGLLGPNGAGKTTAVRILSTLIRLDGGHATVAGLDVARRPAQVRARIGLTGQYAAVDEVLTGRQNLEMFGRLFHLGARRARQRADELLERFDLVAAADRGVGKYSGGMRRRLDLAASMILAPDVLFLDEPLSGLDANSVMVVKEMLALLAAQGKAIFYSSHIMDVVEKISSRIVLLDGGRIVADGSFDELKAQNHEGSLEQIFNQLTGFNEHQDIASRLVSIVQGV